MANTTIPSELIQASVDLGGSPTTTTQSASDNTTKIATTAYVTSAVNALIDSAPGTMNTLNEIAAALNDDAAFNTTVTNAIATKLPLGGGTMTGNIALGDNNKAIFGAGSDLQIYHDGGDSFIQDAGTGSLILKTGQIIVRSTNNETMARFIENGTVDLYYDNAVKLATTATGIDVTGTVVADGLTTSGNLLVNGITAINKTAVASAVALTINSDASTTSSYGLEVCNATSNTRFLIDGVGNSSFYGSNNALTARFTSDNKVGIGATSIDGDSLLHLKSNIPNIFFEDTDDNQDWRLEATSVFKLQDVTRGAEVFRIDSSGNLLAGTTSSNYGVAGSQLGVGGNNYMTRSGANPLLLNRLSSDGAILSLMKDGTTIGSIGTFGGTTYFASNSHGFLINGTQIEPSNNSGGRLDNTVDIGSSTYKFKNLYLSGTATMGGLHVYAATGDVGITIETGEDNGAREPSLNLKSYATNANPVINFGDRVGYAGFIEYENQDDSMRFGTATSEKMRIVNNTASGSGGTSGNGVAFSNAGIAFDRSWGNFPGINVCNTSGTSQTNQSEFRIHGNNNTYNSYPSASGSDFSVNLRIDGSTYISSDRRKKTEITSLTSAIDTVKQLDGKRFKIISSEGKTQDHLSKSGYTWGFIAQDIEDVVPDIVKHYEDEDDDTEEYNNAYAVNYAAMVALLTNAIKEQQTLIESLTARIETLEG